MINVTLGEVKTQEEKPFPKLMINKNTGNVYLFRSKFKCTLLKDGTVYEEKEDLTTECTDYNEPITLQNA